MKKIFLLIIVFAFSSNLFAEYKRIISLAPSVTESLYELGEDKEIIAVTVYCPKGSSKKEIIGTLTEPNLEKIIALKPDLIVSTKEGNNKSSVEKMQRLGFKVYVMETFSSFEEICSNFQNLANFIGKGDTAASIICGVKGEIDLIYDRTKKFPNEKIFWEIGAKPLFSAGKKSFINDYNKFAGGINIFGHIDKRYPNVTLETVVEKNPDVIILVNMGDIGKEEMLNWDKYKNVNAVKNNRLYMLEANDIFTPTPKTFLKGVKIVEKVLHKRAVNE